MHTVFVDNHKKSTGSRFIATKNNSKAQWFSNPYGLFKGLFSKRGANYLKSIAPLSNCGGDFEQWHGNHHFPLPTMRTAGHVESRFNTR